MSLGSQLDLMATFAELASVKLPNKTLDSHSLAPLLLEDKESMRKRGRERGRGRGEREGGERGGEGREKGERGEREEREGE